MEWESVMIWLLKVGVRTGLVAAAMAVTLPMITFAQATEPAIESAPAVAKPAAADTSPRGDENSTDNDTSVQNGLSAKLAIPAAVEVEIQSRFNELRRELLDNRAETIDWWLAVVAIVLTFFGIVVAIAGFLGFSRFREIETEAKSSVKIVTDYAEAAERHVKEIEKNKDKSDKIVQGMNAQTAADDPEKASQAVANVRENPRASLIDKAIAHAISLQQEGKRNDAIKKWRAIAHVAEGTDNEFAAAAWFSYGYLLQNENPEDAILAYDQAIRLKPDLAEAYTNRGNVKVSLERHDDAIADYDEAIRLKPDDDKTYSNRGVSKTELKRYDDAMADHDEAIRRNPNNVMAYNNRGITKAGLRLYDDAIADHDEAIRLKPDFAEAYYNRGIAKNALGLKDEARKDFETALELARNTNNANIVAKAEERLRNLATDEGS